MELTQKILKKLIHYDPDTGIFTWLKRNIKLFSHCKFPDRACNTWNSKYCGVEAGYIAKKKSGSYISIAIGKTISRSVAKYQAHRLAWLYIIGEFPNYDIDHEDHDGTNNSWNNLRDVNNQENHKNVKMHADNESGYTGISWNKRQKYWDVRVQIGGTPVFRKGFKNIKDAICARDNAWREYGFHKNHGRKY